MGNLMRLDTSGFQELIAKIDALEGNVKGAVEDALGQSAETIREDTIDALSPSYLPARGRYSHGDTKRSVVSDNSVHWEGLTAYVPVGFDFSKPGAGGYLISGTPRMRPNMMLNKMYRQKSYMKQIQEDMWDVFMDYLNEAMGL